MIVDTSALFAFFDASDPHHEAVDRAITGHSEPLVVSPYVVAELDYLVAKYHGTPAELAVLRELVGGAWTLADFGADALRQATRLVEKYSDQSVGIADASLVVLADEHRTRMIASS